MATPATSFDPLARLLAPYRAAVEGTPTSTSSISTDPLLSLLLPSINANDDGTPSPAQNGDGTLHPVLQALLDRLPWLDVVSGVRSTEHQQELWEAALQKYGDPEIADNWVARPGTSQHESGNAIDVARDDIARLVQFLSSHPKWGNRVGRPMSWEDWHFQPSSTF